MAVVATFARRSVLSAETFASSTVSSDRTALAFAAAVGAVLGAV